MTPEGRVKDMVKDYLRRRNVKATHPGIIHAHWPVQRGMGTPTLDCNVTINGYAMSVETKAPGETPTPRQWLTIQAKRRAKEIVLVVDGSFTTMRDLEHCVDLLLSNSHFAAQLVSDNNLGEFKNG